MDTYRTEEEQIAAIRKFAAENGAKVLAVIVAAIALFFAVQNWQQSQQKNKENASLLYSELSTAATAGASMTDENKAIFDAAYEQLMSEYGDSLYASYASFFKAKMSVEAGELDAAEMSLQWVVDANVNKDVTALAVLRLARVKASNEKREAALVLLSGDAGPYSAAFAEAQGDIYITQGDDENALIAYKKADAAQTPGFSLSAQMLKMKIESLDKTQQDKIFALQPVASSDK